VEFIDHNGTRLELSLETSAAYMVCMAVSDPEDECTTYFYVNSDNYEQIIDEIRKLMLDPDGVFE
jgi:hypothetical protein